MIKKYRKTLEEITEELTINGYCGDVHRDQVLELDNLCFKEEVDTCWCSSDGRNVVCISDCADYRWLDIVKE